MAENTLSRRIREYAELIVKIGLDPDPGQEVFITCNLDQPDFVRLVVEQCYRAGTGPVHVNWLDQQLDKLHVKYQSEKELSRLSVWDEARWRYQAQKLPCRLYLDSDDPDAMTGVDVGKYSCSLQEKMRRIKPYRNKMENRHQWCIAAVPGRAWARRVFPAAAGKADAERRLWRAILDACRVDGKAPAIVNWERHNAALKAKCAQLNALELAFLRYHSAEGTDLTVGLMPEGLFAGGSEQDLSGRVFNPNLPSEEVFTTPKAGLADGWAQATKPLSYQGQLIEDFAIRFADGRATEVRAASGREVLEKIISMDDRAGYLGECALIPQNSPINRQNLLFFNTLFDENACCHLALGRGFDVCVRDFAHRPAEELRRLGVNDSIVHVDFMIGSSSLDITGIDFSGREHPLFRHGDWAEF